MIYLASNENCLGPSPLAIQAIDDISSVVNRYPDASGQQLRDALGASLHVSPSQIVLGNGSTELVEIIARCFVLPQQSVITAHQTFMMYRQAAQSCHADFVEVPNQVYGYDLQAILHAITEKTRVIFIANPNNPTGMMVTKSDLDGFLVNVPSDVIVVLDEAYCEYIDQDDYPNGLEYLSRFENVIVLRTFSKIYGLAGLRIGYAVATETVAARLNRIRAIYNSNLIALAAAIAALSDHDHVERSRQMNQQELEFLRNRLEALNVRVLPSVANFLLLLVGDSQQLYEKLLGFGIATRPMHASNLPEGLRVTVGTHEENVALIEALQKITKA